MNHNAVHSASFSPPSFSFFLFFPSCSFVALSRQVTKAWQSASALYDVQKQYFTYQMQLMKTNPTPSIITNALNSGKPIAIADLQNHFGGPSHVGLACVLASNKAFLSQVELCYAKDSTGRPTKQIACPDTVLSDDYDNNCVTKNVKEIYITPFN